MQSGTINVPGGKQALGAGGVILDDNQANGKLSSRSISLKANRYQAVWLRTWTAFPYSGPHMPRPSMKLVSIGARIRTLSTGPRTAASSISRHFKTRLSILAYINEVSLLMVITELRLSRPMLPTETFPRSAGFSLQEPCRSTHRIHPKTLHSSLMKSLVLLFMERITMRRSF